MSKVFLLAVLLVFGTPCVLGGLLEQGATSRIVFYRVVQQYKNFGVVPAQLSANNSEALRLRYMDDSLLEQYCIGKGNETAMSILSTEFGPSKLVLIRSDQRANHNRYHPVSRKQA